MDFPPLEQLECSFAKIAVLEINLQQRRFIQSTAPGERVTQDRPAQLQHFSVTWREGMSGKPGCGQSNRWRRASLTEIIRNPSNLFQFASRPADSRAGISETQEG